MKELIELLSDFNDCEVPFLAINEEKPTIYGKAEEAYKGKLKVTNHISVLEAVARLILLFDGLETDKLSEEELLTSSFLYLYDLQIAYFGEKQEVDIKICKQILNDSKEVINQALLYLVSLKGEEKKLKPRELKVKANDTGQFIDTYFSIGCSLVNEKIISTEELYSLPTSMILTLYAKKANDQSLKNYLEWQQSQTNEKPQVPEKQLFYFGEVEPKKEGQDV